MKRKIIFATLFLLLCLQTTNLNVCADYETDFDAFNVGDYETTQATFKFLGEEKTMAVWELKEMLKKLGYGQYFAGDKPDAGYTTGVKRAFQAYVELYEKKLKDAEKGLQAGVRKD